MTSAVEQQRAAATLILNVISGDDFALAGSGALREHGLIDRPTQDVDLFTIEAATERFVTAVERTIATLTKHGYHVVPVRSAAQFARLAVTASDDYQFEVDFGVDWRAHDPSGLRSDRYWRSLTRSRTRSAPSIAGLPPATSSTWTPSANPDVSATRSFSSSPPNTIPDSTCSCSLTNSARW